MGGSATRQIPGNAGRENDMDDKQGHPEKQGLPGEPGQNHEVDEPTEPSRKPAGRPEGGDPDSGGESGEGSQSTGNPNSAG